MRNWTKAAVLGGIALVMPVAAMAADFTPPPTYYYPPPPVEIGSTWYLRVDGGFKMYRPVEAQFYAPGLGYDIPGAGEMINESLSNTGVIGWGFGVQATPHFRLDFTMDYEWPGEFYGELECPDPCGALPPTQYSIETADISALTFLANFYWDMSVHGKFTPYLGVGIGASRLTTSNVAFVNPDLSEGTWTGLSTWNLAWAAMAGATYDLNDSWAVDFNYRFVSLGNAHAQTSLIGNPTIDYLGISAHEVRLGLRYTIW